MELVQCIPNFSEGRNQDVIDMLVHCAKNIKGVTILNHSSDIDHNRTVITALGAVDRIQDFAVSITKVAVENIDLNKHTGAHPRMGAVDVMPFVPIKNVSMQRCIELSKDVGERINKQFGIPVILYEESCTGEIRRNLANIREGGFENMAAKLLTDDFKPDYGESKIHKTAGVLAVGARKPLIAFNVTLSTANVDIAEAIAKAIRGKSGGYTKCKAIGVMLNQKGVAQVSMNLVDYNVTPIYRVFEAIKFEAKRWGVSVIGSELIGCSPFKAMMDCCEYYLKLDGFDFDSQIIENHLI